MDSLVISLCIAVSALPVLIGIIREFGRCMAASRVGFIAYEGERDSTGNNFQINGTNLNNALKPVGYPFNSTIPAALHASPPRVPIAPTNWASTPTCSTPRCYQTTPRRPR